MDNKGIIHIKVFEMLDRIRDDNNITADAWVTASDLKPARVTELRKYAQSEGGRPLSLKTMHKLISGFEQIMGVAMTKQEILKHLENIRKEIPPEDFNHLLITLIGTKCNQDLTPILEAMLHKK